MNRKARLLIVLILTAAAAAMLAGCGKQTEEANQLVDQVNSIAAEVQPKIDQVDKLLGQATDQLAQGKTTDEQASLTQAQALIDDILGQIQDAKDKTDQAAGLDITEAHRQYLEAKGRALQELIGLMQTYRQMTVVLQADPTVAKPETLSSYKNLENTAASQAQRLQDAENEASNVAATHSDELSQ